MDMPSQTQQQQLRELLRTYLDRSSPTFRHALLRHQYGAEQIYYLTFRQAKRMPTPEQGPPHARLAFALELAILVIAAQLLVELARAEEWQHLVQVALRDGWDLEKAFQSAQALLSQAVLQPERCSPLTQSSENKRLIAPLFGFAYHPEKRRYIAYTERAGAAMPDREDRDADA